MKYYFFLITFFFCFHFSSSQEPQSSNCNTSSCQKCKSLCPSFDQLKSLQKRCQVLYSAALKYMKHAHQSCLAPECAQRHLESGCNVIPLDASKDEFSQIQQATNTLNEEINEIEGHKLGTWTGIENPEEYDYKRKLAQVSEYLSTRVKDALLLRQRYAEILDFANSLAYRKLEQEVKRYQFEFVDLERHYQYWIKEKQNLELAVRTSPEALKEVRDRLKSTLNIYTNDANMLSLLQNTSLTKEQKAELIKMLKEEVEFQLQNVEDNLERIEREEQFITEARREIYNLLRNILIKVSKGQLQVGCGGNELSTLVTTAIDESS